MNFDAWGGFAVWGLVFLAAAVLLAVVMSDALLQRLALAFRGAALSPRQLLTVRKAGYVVLIVYLFTGAFFWRRAVVDALPANQLVREQSIGDVHLTGALTRLSLGGFRGVTTCYLWNLAMDKQMKNQLNELEVIVGWLTDLQPHFNTPWLFQSWNLAYNVSNKTDQPADKYFWISRGVQLLADGERQNHDDPDLRFELGTTYQHKICQSDETNYHRSLFQLSLIPPNERDPARFRPKRGSRRKINMEEFANFCSRHPQLIRRLREGIHKDNPAEQRRLFSCATPAAVVQFLADNYRVPSLYPDAKPTPPGGRWVENKDRSPDPFDLQRFPVLPPPPGTKTRPSPHVYQPYNDMGGDLTEKSPMDLDTGLDQNDDPLDDWDGFIVARSWYSYAQEPLPAPSEIPGETGPITDPVHQRLNRHMETIIFRHYPARAQSYIAERLEEEGWFDDEGWSTKGPGWFAKVIGTRENWAVNAWGEAYKMWQAHGERNHILLSAEDEANLRKQAIDYRTKRGLTPTLFVPPVEPDKGLQDEWKAARFMEAFDAKRDVAHFSHNYMRALVEQDKKTVRARKLFYQGEALALTASTVLALQMYQDPEPDPVPVLGGLSALQAWAKILEDHNDYRHDDLIQEQSFEIELTYQDLLFRALPANEMKAELGAASAFAPGGWLNPAALLEVRRPDAFPTLTFTKGPFDREEADGTPWIPPNVIRSVLERRRQFQPHRKDTDTQAAAPTPGAATPAPVAPPGAKP